MRDAAHVESIHTHHRHKLQRTYCMCGSVTWCGCVFRTSLSRASAVADDVCVCVCLRAMCAVSVMHACLCLCLCLFVCMLCVCVRTCLSVRICVTACVCLIQRHETSRISRYTHTPHTHTQHKIRVQRHATCTCARGTTKHTAYTHTHTYDTDSSMRMSALHVQLSSPSSLQPSHSMYWHNRQGTHTSAACKQLH